MPAAIMKPAMEQHEKDRREKETWIAKGAQAFHDEGPRTCPTDDPKLRVFWFNGYDREAAKGT